MALAVGLGTVLAVATLVGADTIRRGRPAGWWLAGCLVLLPVFGPLWLAVAVIDRWAGRPGIEGSWPRHARVAGLGAVLLAVSAALVALAPVTVRGARVSSPTYSADFSGRCGPALQVALDGAPLAVQPAPLTAPAPVRAAGDEVALRCSEGSGRRLSISGVLLGGAVVVLVSGGVLERRPRRPAVVAGGTGGTPT